MFLSPATDGLEEGKLVTRLHGELLDFALRTARDIVHDNGRLCGDSEQTAALYEGYVQEAMERWVPA